MHFNSKFTASDGWLFNFSKLKILTLRRITKTDRELPINTGGIIKEFLDNCSNLYSINPG